MSDGSYGLDGSMEVCEQSWTVAAARGSSANCMYAASPLRRAMVRTPLITSFALTRSHTRVRCRTHDGSGDNLPPNDVRAPKVRSIAPRQANTPRPKTLNASGCHCGRFARRHVETGRG